MELYDFPETVGNFITPSDVRIKSMALPGQVPRARCRSVGRCDPALGCQVQLWPWPWSVLGSLGLPSGELTFCHGKSPFLMGKSTISMAIFNCYVSSPEGNLGLIIDH